MRERASARHRLTGRWSLATLLLIAIAATAITFVRSARDVRQFPGVDLRSKVVGARRMIRGLNPYYDPTKSIPPDHVRMLYQNTYSPALLALYVPLAELPYRTQRQLYAAADWLMMGAVFLLLYRLLPRAGLPFLAFFLLVAIADFGFLLHAERGQYYVLLLLLSTLAAARLYRSEKSLAAAAALAFLTLLRPTYLLLPVCLLLYGWRTTAIRTAGLALAFFCLLLPLTGIQNWLRYYNNVRAAEAQELAAIDHFPAYLPPLPPLQGTVIEGIDFGRARDDIWYRADRTLIVSNYRGVLGMRLRWLGLTNSTVVWRVNVAALLAVVLLACWISLRARTSASDRLNWLAFLFLVPIAVETFGPQHNSYCDVVLVLPVMLLFLRRARLDVAMLGWLACVFLIPFLSALPFASNADLQLLGIAGDLRWFGLLAFCWMAGIRELVLRPPTATVRGPESYPCHSVV